MNRAKRERILKALFGQYLKRVATRNRSWWKGRAGFWD